MSPCIAFLAFQNQMSHIWHHDLVVLETVNSLFVTRQGGCTKWQLRATRLQRKGLLLHIYSLNQTGIQCSDALAFEVGFMQPF